MSFVGFVQTTSLTLKLYIAHYMEIHGYDENIKNNLSTDYQHHKFDSNI